MKQVKEVIVWRVPSPSEEPWWSQTPQAVKVLLKKRNWRAPELDRQVNYWWKCVTALSEDEDTTAFWSISMIEDPYPTWFSEGEKQG